MPLERDEFEARLGSLEARVTRIEVESVTRYDRLLEKIGEIKQTLATRDARKLEFLFTALLSFIGGGGMIALLEALHVLGK